MASSFNQKPSTPDSSTEKGLIERISSISKDLLINTSGSNPLASNSEADSRIPQGSVVERNLQSFKLKRWREHYGALLSGEGLELGALNRPLPVHSGMKVQYVDQFPKDKLREMYPELENTEVVEPDILDDAETLATVENGKYDFVIAAHVIEHMKNPIQAIENWLRVVKKGGKVYLVIPDKRASFDKMRVRTSFGALNSRLPRAPLAKEILNITWIIARMFWVIPLLMQLIKLMD